MYLGPPLNVTLLKEATNILETNHLYWETTLLEGLEQFILSLFRWIRMTKILHSCVVGSDTRSSADCDCIVDTIFKGRLQSDVVCQVPSFSNRDFYHYQPIVSFQLKIVVCQVRSSSYSSGVQYGSHESHFQRFLKLKNYILSKESWDSFVIQWKEDTRYIIYFLNISIN